MKFTAEQIKTFVKKTAKGNSTISQITIRNYIMERFLERLSLSEFKNKFILKGGLLIASIVRKDTRDVPFLSPLLKRPPIITHLRWDARGRSLFDIF